MVDRNALTLMLMLIKRKKNDDIWNDVDRGLFEFFDVLTCPNFEGSSLHAHNLSVR